MHVMPGGHLEGVPVKGERATILNLRVNASALITKIASGSVAVLLDSVKPHIVHPMDALEGWIVGVLREEQGDRTSLKLGGQCGWSSRVGSGSHKADFNMRLAWECGSDACETLGGSTFQWDTSFWKGARP